MIKKSAIFLIFVFSVFLLQIAVAYGGDKGGLCMARKETRIPSEQKCFFTNNEKSCREYFSSEKYNDWGYIAFLEPIQHHSMRCNDRSSWAPLYERGIRGNNVSILFKPSMGYDGR